MQSPKFVGPYSLNAPALGLTTREYTFLQRPDIYLAVVCWDWYTAGWTARKAPGLKIYCCVTLQRKPWWGRPA